MTITFRQEPQLPRISRISYVTEQRLHQERIERRRQQRRAETRLRVYGNVLLTFFTAWAVAIAFYAIRSR